MRQIPKKNYIILLFIFILVVVITFAGKRIYENNIKKTSVLFKYLKVIKSDELELYLNENPSTAIYISEKYDVENNDVEENIKNKIIKYNLYNNFVYLDKQELSEEVLEKIKRKYNISLSINKLPTLIIFNDNSVTNIYYQLTLDIVNQIEFGDIK